MTTTMTTGFEGMTRAQFLGRPIIKETLAAGILLREPSSLRAVKHARFLDGFTAKISSGGCAVFKAGELIAGYARGRTDDGWLIVADGPHRQKGIASEMIYRVALLNPGKPLPSKARTKFLQRACERAADRIFAPTA